MSACETCWTEASRRALMRGGHTADHYKALLAEHPRGHCTCLSYAAGGDGPEVDCPVHGITADSVVASPGGEAEK